MRAPKTIKVDGLFYIVHLSWNLWTVDQTTLFSHRSAWTVTMSAACSTHQGDGGEEEEEAGCRLRRVALGPAETARPVIITRDPSETEGWRRTNRTLLHWWTECRKYTTGGPSHLDTHQHTHTQHTPASGHKPLQRVSAAPAFSFSVFVKHTNTHISSAWEVSVVKLYTRGRLASSGLVFEHTGLVSFWPVYYLLSPEDWQI